MATPTLLKSNWVVLNGEDARVIDNNAVIDEKVRQYRAQQEEQIAPAMPAASFDAFDEDSFPVEEMPQLDPEQLAALTEDQSAQEYAPEEAMYQDAPAPPVEEAPADVQMLVQDARATADQIIAEANEQATTILAQAREEGMKRGYDEGFARAQAEVEARVQTEVETAITERREQLENEYRQLTAAIEPEMVDTLTRIYEHVFGVNFAGDKKVVMHLLQTALSRIEPNDDFMIHVSPDDYDMVLDEKENLKQYITSPNATMELIEDPILHENECMIETNGGIFDCSLGVELSELSRKLRLLAFDRRRNPE